MSTGVARLGRIVSPAVATSVVVLIAGACGSSGPAAVSVPPTMPTSATVPTTMPTSATVAVLGLRPAVLPATAANASANAAGACSRPSPRLILLPQEMVSTALAQQYLRPVEQFANAAATGNPTQWGQLRTDVAALVSFVGSGTWAASTSQGHLAPVQTVDTDCAPLD